MLYDWVKALHLISMVSWMAATLYLPRLYVYHSQSDIGSDKSETFKIMEKKLLRYIMNPAMILTFIFGIILIGINPSWLYYGWLHTKLLLVMMLAAYHGFLSSCRRAFAEDRNTYSARFYKIANEIPTLLMIAIIILVVVKPF